MATPFINNGIDSLFFDVDDASFYSRSLLPPLPVVPHPSVAYQQYSMCKNAYSNFNKIHMWYRVTKESVDVGYYGLILMQVPRRAATLHPIVINKICFKNRTFRDACNCALSLTPSIEFFLSGKLSRKYTNTEHPYFVQVELFDDAYVYFRVQMALYFQDVPIRDTMSEHGH